MTFKSILFNLLLLTICSVSCNNHNSTQTLPDENIKKDSLYFRYEKIVNKEIRFIEFWENKMIWGKDSVRYTHPYDGSMDLDNMGPKERKNGYDIEFLEHEIKIAGPVKFLYFNFNNDIIYEGEIREVLFLYHSDTINGEFRFIEFNENEIFWGNDSLTYTHTYSTDKLTESLNPKQNSPRYKIIFSKNYIIYQWKRYGTNQKYPPINIKQSGTTISVFNFKDNNIKHFTHVNSLDFKQELFISHQFQHYGKINYKFPFIISDFDGNYSQFIELEIDDCKPNPITSYQWLKDTIIISYLDSSQQLLIDTTLFNYDSNINSYLLDTLK